MTFRVKNDDYNAIMVEALADRLGGGIRGVPAQGGAR